ncbi:MAG: inorganic phosphate transporter, partial [Clostridiales bacterium]|nr:inorganic phosphate transporter [Clostridiales bacterium]
MTVHFNEFLNEFLTNPALTIAILLTLGSILVNGLTDATNAIATVISTRSLGPRSAILMAAGLNFLGVLVMTMINTSVAMTIFSLADFSGEPHIALLTLSAALISIVIWSSMAIYLGMPTSESHALIAGLSGAAIALRGGFSAINGSQWMKVIYGLGFSSVFGFIAGFVIVKIVGLIFQKVDRRKTLGFFRGAQIFGSAAMAFMHGAQDGQKFMGAFMLAAFLAKGQGGVESLQIPIWIMLICASVLALGTSMGGYKIIKSVGMDMVKLEKYQGFSADLAAALGLLVSSIFGFPVSTTHTKTTAIMGVGSARRISA